MKDVLTCIVIDDEPLIEEILSDYIKKVSFLKLIGSFSSALDASAAMERGKPDLLFVDINMPDLDGLSFISMLNPKPDIIITTAYDEFAVKAFELGVKDYLVKPISFERFYKSVLRLYQDSRGHSEEKTEMRSARQIEKDFIFIRSGTRILKINTEDILLIEGMKDYLRIHTLKSKILILMTFAKIEEILPPGKFFRVHKSYMIALDKIDHIENNRIRIGDQIIPISNTYSENFLKMLKGY